MLEDQVLKYILNIYYKTLNKHPYKHAQAGKTFVVNITENV